AMCFEPDVATGSKSGEHWRFVGEGQGCLVAIGIALFLALFLILRPFFRHEDVSIPSMDFAHDCTLTVDTRKKAFCCTQVYIGCEVHHDHTTTPAVHSITEYHYVTRIHRVPQKVYVKTPYPVPKVVYHTVVKPRKQPYDCDEGFDDWKKNWPLRHQRFCCYLRRRACQVKVVNHDKYVTVTHMKLVPEYIHVKPSEDESFTVPKYVPYPVPSKPIKVMVRGPPRYRYHTVKKYKYIDVPTPGKPHVIEKRVPIPVPAPPKIINEKTIVTVHHRHFDCAAGYSNWYFGWSKPKKVWCCDHENKGCPGTWKGHMHLVTHVTTHVGHAHGHIYDCNAGFSNWMQGWSDSKKAWCCRKEHRGCVPHHCDGEVSDWTHAKRDWCCSHFQKGCPKTTYSPLKCDAPCTHKGHTATCADRLTWAEEHLFKGRGNACALAYSQVQVDCDVCRACSIEDAGCTVHVDTSPAFDCNAALNNFFRAWSPAKKQWCCTQQGKGCEGTTPPHVDPGFGMVWKRVQVNGYWTWIAVHGSGGPPASLPYDCHAGLGNFQYGWSQGKKGWCCSHMHLGCGGGGGDGGTYVTHHTVTYVTHAGAGGAGGAGGGAVGAGAAGGGGAAGAGHPPGVAAAGMMWHWSQAGGSSHWVQQQMAGAPAFDCNAGYASWKLGWSGPKKHWCCLHIGKGCL
ncbi:Ide, partial [Symbiodinium pilosum]